MVIVFVPFRPWANESLSRCFRTLPVEAARHFIESVKVEENAEVIRLELKAIDGRYGAHTDEEPVITAHPCPFTLFLLAMAFNADIGHEIYASGATFLHSNLKASTTPSSIKNDEGITVFDVTDPANPSYCLSEGRHGPPITAVKYAYDRARHSGYPDLDEELRTYLEGVNLISRSALFEAWPADFECPANHDSSEASGRRSPDLEVLLPSLSNLTLKPAVEKAIADEDTEALEHFAWNTEKASLILSVLRSRDSFGPAALSLLIKMVETQRGNSPIDLSDLSLTSEQVLEALAGLREPINYLNLSHNPRVTTTTLRSVLETHPRIRRLIVYGTSISDEEITALVCQERSLFYHVEQLIHPAFFSYRQMATPAFSFCVANAGVCDWRNINAVSLPYVNVSAIIQSLGDLLRACITLGVGPGPLGGGIGDSQTPLLALFSGAPREEGRRWGQRTVVCCPLPSSEILSKGWLCIFVRRFGPSSASYGFLRRRTESGGEEGWSKVGRQFEIHHFRSFIAELVKDGYPEPPSSDVEEVAGLLEKLDEMLKTVPGDLYSEAEAGLSLITEAELASAAGAWRYLLETYHSKLPSYSRAIHKQ
ncbi:hypothetical protein PM082_010328 [Marasmius tenuissimus]|nr:hypothetical protein PM082_010328 [Marasmius tenuissimus]